MTRALSRSLVAAMLLCMPLLAKANLISNGGFESGTLAGWSCTGADLCQASTSNGSHSGTYAMVGFDNNGFATLSQTIATTAGQSYDFEFWSRDTIIHAGNILRYQLGAGPIVMVAQSLAFMQTTDMFTAAGASTTVNFYFETDIGTGTWAIDDVLVKAAVAVPEPLSAALLGFGLIALGWGRRSRK